MMKWIRKLFGLKTALEKKQDKLIQNETKQKRRGHKDQEQDSTRENWTSENEWDPIRKSNKNEEGPYVI